MRVFVTGATGFVGRHVVEELIGGGHQVLGLTRSEESARALTALGAEALRGVLEDGEALRRGVAAADAVIHLGFSHDFADFPRSCETDRLAIETMGEALAGSARPFLVTSGLGGLTGPGEVATEETPFPADLPFPRRSEPAALALLERGVCAMVMRLPQVHDPARQGLVSFAIMTAREKGFSAYVGEGSNRWAAVHVRDTARLYRLALEQPEAGAKWHAVDEEGVGLREIAEVIGEGLNVPARSIGAEEAPGHFGWWGGFAGMDLVATSAITRRKLGWTPTGPGLLDDLRRMDYAAV